MATNQILLNSVKVPSTGTKCAHLARTSLATVFIQFQQFASNAEVVNETATV